MQINKYIAHSGVCSRRRADQLVAEGAISVNNMIMKDPAYRLQKDDVVAWKGKVLKPEQHVYIMLNKPAGFVTTTSDEKNRRTVLDLVKLNKKVRLYPIGRLDRATTGLLLLTNDGSFAQKMAHPRTGVVKRYHITLSNPLSPKHFVLLKNGIRLEDGFMKPDRLVFVKGSNRRELLIELHSGKNRIIRRMFRHVGHNVKALDRHWYAGLTKRGVMKGSWRYLTADEVRKLQKN